MTHQILGCDPGTTNAGYSVVDFTKKTFSILEIGMIESTFKNMTDNVQHKKLTKAQRAKLLKQTGAKRITKDMLPSQPPFSEGFLKYYNSVNKLLGDYNLKGMIAERFQTRGNMGPLIEMVSMQLGVFATLSHQMGFPMRLVVASQWKNRINDISNLEDIYTYAHQYGLTPHECDSTGMALYQADHLGIMPLEISLGQWRKAITTYAKRN